MTSKRYAEPIRPRRMRGATASLLGSAASLTLLVVISYAAPLPGAGHRHRDQVRARLARVRRSDHLADADHHRG